jgi:hypothetical protein
MTIMVVPNLRFSVGIALAGLAQFRKEEICKPQIGGSIPLASSTFKSFSGLEKIKGNGKGNTRRPTYF